MLRCLGPEETEVEGKTVTAMAFESIVDGRSHRTWIDPAGRILRMIWGGGEVLIVARSASTRHLFRSIPDALTQVPSGPEKLVMRGELPKVTPVVMFERWAKPDQLSRWWPAVAAVEPWVGGKSHLSWPAKR